eukprot:s5157_g2.t1
MSRAAVNQVLSGSHTQKPQWLRLRCEEPSRQGARLVQRPFLLDSDESLTAFLQRAGPRCVFADVWASVETLGLKAPADLEVPQTGPALLFLHEGTMDFTVGDKVCVLPGRHFQDFAAGHSGMVSMVDRKAQTCQVYFDHRLGSEPLNVAFRNLSRVDGGGECSGSSWPVSSEILQTEELDVAPVLGGALGALASAGYWEGALAHLGSTPSPSYPSGTGRVQVVMQHAASRVARTASC